MCMQTRFSLELAALGTPDMPLNKTRVPRQAATAAKAAIKKDLLMQNSRPGATSVPPKGTEAPVAQTAKASTAKSAAARLQKVQQFAWLTLYHVYLSDNMPPLYHLLGKLHRWFLQPLDYTARSCCARQHTSSWLLHSVVRHLMHTDIQLHAVHSPMIFMQELNPTAKVKRRSNRIMRDNEAPAAQPPAGPIDDDVSLPASALDASDAASDPATEIPAAVATTAGDDAAPLASSAPVASPQLSAKTSPQSCQSPSTSHHTDAMQSAELSGTCFCSSQKSFQAILL